jgi:hypothetical protein
MGLALRREVGTYWESSEERHLPDTEDYAQWSYSGFNRFRTEIAEAVEIDLDAMWGFGGSLEWSAIDSPLVPLLDHPDDHGVLTAEQCATVWPELDRVVREVFGHATEFHVDPEGHHNLTNGLALAEMMRRAAEHGQRVLFC